MAIAFKETNETEYSIDLLHQSDYLDKVAFESIKPDIQESLKLLISIIKSSKQNI